MKYREITAALTALASLNLPIKARSKAGDQVEYMPKYDANTRIKFGYNLNTLRKLADQEGDVRNQMIKARLAKGQTELKDGSSELFEVNQEWEEHRNSEIVGPENKPLKLWRIDISELKLEENDIQGIAMDPLLDVILFGAEPKE